jgi:hypothetical protein
MLNGTFTDLYRTRLKQSELSTRLLQGLLALLFLCAVVAYTNLGPRRILPRNPTSIASLASLMAGSEILSDKVIPPGAEWWSDKESERRGLFAGYVFSLGWWRVGNEETGRQSQEQRFGLDIGRAEDRIDEKMERVLKTKNNEKGIWRRILPALSI